MEAFNEVHIRENPFRYSQTLHCLTHRGEIRFAYSVTEIIPKNMNELLKFVPK
jgi:hypothetical protein